MNSSYGNFSKINIPSYPRQIFFMPITTPRSIPRFIASSHQNKILVLIRHPNVNKEFVLLESNNAPPGFLRTIRGTGYLRYI
ncbi:hypothetical protein CW304_01480 [Bacillus sp. UFRGS-B20]|nr:hypothetical protein CW304_01480 [Bacillus sp. UFRGS-B20]